jgi:hypothetical protein
MVAARAWQRRERDRHRWQREVARESLSTDAARMRCSPCKGSPLKHFARGSAAAGLIEDERTGYGSQQNALQPPAREA